MTVVTALLLVTVTALVTSLSVAERATVRQQKRSEAMDDIRLAMQRVTKELRQVTAVRSASASTLDVDTYIQGNAAHVMYAASGTTLSRTVNGVTLPLVTRLVSTDVFTYSPSATAPTAITVRIRARPAKFSTDSTVLELVGEVKVRNL